VYNILFRSAAETLKTLSCDPVYSYGRIGFICVLHTWGQNLMDHPHLHCIVTGGGLSDDDTTWIPCKKDFLFPVSVMSRLFRGKFLAYLVEHYKKSELKFPGAIITLQQRRIFNSLISKLYRKEWVVYSKPPFKNPETVFRYLSRYTHRIAISNQRIINVSEGKVHFLWRDYADGNTTKVMVLDAYEFIRRFLLHILPEKFVKIRYYGLFGNKNHRVSIEKCRSILHVHRTPREVKQEQWQELMLRITGFNVSSCPLCEHGTMKMAHSLPSVRCNGPPAVSK